MKLDVRSVVLAAANVTAMSFVLCGLFFKFAHGAAGRFFDLLLHTNLGATWRAPGWGGLLLGTVAWWVLTAVFVCAVATLYNRGVRA